MSRRRRRTSGRRAGGVFHLAGYASGEDGSIWLFGRSGETSGIRLLVAAFVADGSFWQHTLFQALSRLFRSLSHAVTFGNIRLFADFWQMATFGSFRLTRPHFAAYAFSVPSHTVASGSVRSSSKGQFGASCGRPRLSAVFSTINMRRLPTLSRL